MLTTKGMKKKDQILFLSNMDFKPKEVAELIGTTANTVSVTLAKAKKAAQPATQESRAPDGEQGT